MVIERNLHDNTCTDDLEKLKIDLMNWGHKTQLLEHKEPLPRGSVKGNDITVRTHDDKVAYSLKYFDDMKKLKGKT